LFSKNPPIVNELLKFFIENYSIVSTSRRVGRFWVGTFYGWDVLGFGGHLEAWDVLELGCFGVGMF
jgi:hypothetical protein